MRTNTEYTISERFSSIGSEDTNAKQTQEYTVTECLFKKWPWIYSVCRNHNSVLSLFKTYHRFCNKSSTTDTTCGEGTGCPSGAPEFTSGFSGVCVARSLFFCVMFCRLLFVFFLLVIMLSVRQRSFRFTASD
jgi:hypothetical protein